MLQRITNLDTDFNAVCSLADGLLADLASLSSSARSEYKAIQSHANAVALMLEDVLEQYDKTRNALLQATTELTSA